MKPSQYHIETTLSDGRKLIIRSIRPSDKQALAEGFQKLSLEAIQSRFFMPKKSLSEGELRFLTEVDFESHVALIAEIFQDGRWQLCAAARFIQSKTIKQPKTAEIAIIVGDEVQRLGIGSLLLSHLTKLAVHLGYQQFEAEIMNENKAILGLLEKCNLDLSKRPHPGSSHYFIDILE